MNLIPAIDLLHGQVVRLFQGDYSQSTEYSRQPEEMLAIFEEAGCPIIHLVDLDGARSGQPIHLDILRRLAVAKQPHTRLEWGGGLRSLMDVRQAAEAGADRLILGTSLISQPQLVVDALKELGPERLIAGVDARDGIAKIAGWRDSTEIPALELIRELEGKGLREVIFTDISTDGTLAGPALESYRNILDHSGMRLVASGGIGRLEHVRSLLDLAAEYPGRLVGAISGRAIYEGMLDPREAQEMCRAATGP